MHAWGKPDSSFFSGLLHSTGSGFSEDQGDAASSWIMRVAGVITL